MKIRILEKSEAIRKYLKDLEYLSIDSKDKLENKEKYYASSMIIFSILNDFFVLGDEIIDFFDLDIAQTYKEIFIILEKKKFITKDDAKYCSRIVYLRNKFAHEYGNITKDELFELINKIGNVQDIIDKLIDRVKKED